jgi:four helix bundle protein
MHKYKELKIWKEGMLLAQMTYKVASLFPNHEQYGLTSQIKRAVVSIPSNIAEGAGRSSNKEFSHFLCIAMGSAFELETQLMLARDFDFISKAQFEEIWNQVNKVQRMINGFRISINDK